MIHFDLAHKQKEIEEIEQEMMAEGFWDDHAQSQATIEKLNQLKKIVETHQEHLFYDIKNRFSEF